MFIFGAYIFQRSVPVKFRGKYLQFAMIPQKLMKFQTINTKNDPIIFSANITKLHRSDPSKSVKRDFIITSKTVYILNEKSFDLCEAVPIENITGISFSPFSDGVLALHIDKTEKRDYLFVFEEHLIEMVANMVLIMKEINPKGVPLIACVSKYAYPYHAYLD